MKRAAQLIDEKMPESLSLSGRKNKRIRMICLEVAFYLS